MPDSLNDKELLSAYVARVDVKSDHLAVQLFAKSERDGAAGDRAEQDERVHRDLHVLVVPGKRPRQSDRERSFGPSRHPLIPTPVQSALKPASSLSRRSLRDGIGSMS